MGDKQVGAMRGAVEREGAIIVGSTEADGPMGVLLSPASNRSEAARAGIECGDEAWAPTVYVDHSHWDDALGGTGSGLPPARTARAPVR